MKKDDRNNWRCFLFGHKFIFPRKYCERCKKEYKFEPIFISRPED